MKTLALLLAVPLLLLAACEGTPGPKTAGGHLASDGFPAPDKDIVYQTAVQTVAAYGFTPDLDMSVPSEGTLISRWNYSMSPFSNQGHRDQVHVHIREVAGRASYYQVETKVNRQKNANMQDPSSIAAADWSGGERVPDLENMINRRIEMKFLPVELSPEFRRRYGMEGGRDPRIFSGDIPPPPRR